MPVVIGFDTETWLIRPGCLTPPLVCGSFAVGGFEPQLRLRDDTVDAFESMLDDPNVHLAIHNAAFDLAVLVSEKPSLLPKVFAALADGRVHCTKTREMMIHNALVGLTDDNGPKVSFALSEVVKRRFFVDISESKTDPDAWRLRYKELDGVPLDQWPEAAVNYAKDDATWHLRVYEDQEKHGSDYLKDEPGQTRAAFALHLMACYGLVTDEAAIQKLEAELTAHVESANEKLRASGLLKGKSTKKKATGLIEVTWSKDTKKIKALVEDAYTSKGLLVPKTEPSDADPETGAPGKFPEGQTKTDEETLRATGHPDLLVLAEVGNDAKMLSVWVPALKGLDKKGNERGLRTPHGWVIQPTWNVLVATGRTSVYAPPVQQPPRKGAVRPCFVPRPGYWYCSVDYSFIELVTWAQTCLDLFGMSRMAEVINAGVDPHVDLAVELLRRLEGKNVSYEECLAAKKTWGKDPRQKAKAGNFGYPGGLGAKTFVTYAKGNYGVDITEEQSWGVKNAWKSKWPENEPYFNHISQIQQKAFGQPFTVTHPRTGFVRGGCTFTSGCNTLFQGLAARGAKEAMFDVARECYVDEASDLYGCRPVLFLHDELILEVPAHRELAHLASMRLQRVMEEAMSRFTPDVKVGTEPTLMARWFKEAEPVWGADGVLELWTPKEDHLVFLP